MHPSRGAIRATPESRVAAGVDQLGVAGIDPDHIERLVQRRAYIHPGWRRCEGVRGFEHVAWLAWRPFVKTRKGGVDHIGIRGIEREPIYRTRRKSLAWIEVSPGLAAIASELNAAAGRAVNVRVARLI